MIVREVVRKVCVTGVVAYGPTQRYTRSMRRKAPRAWSSRKA